MPTFPVKGKVLVDGEPANYLGVTLNPIGGDIAQLPASAFTDDAGNFTIGTYEGTDGAPVGEYTLTFFWGQINLMSGRFEGPDKLNNRYTDPEKSEFKVSVKEGSETDLGVLELTSK